MTDEHPDHFEHWVKVADDEEFDLDNFYKEKKYRASVDSPTFNYWKKILQKYPEAKVILTVRDEMKWYESAKRTVFTVMPGSLSLQTLKKI
jgi:hypothetical protein